MKKLLLLFVFLLSVIGNAQINFTQGFESATLPSGWTVGAVPYSLSTVNPIAGARSFVFNIPTTGQSGPLTSPAYTSNGNAIQISFSSKETGSSQVYYNCRYQINQSPSVLLTSSTSTNGRIGSMNVVTNTYTIPAGVALNTADVKFSVEAFQSPTSPSTSVDMYIDNFTVSQSGVTTPSITSVSASNITSTSASINYTLGANNANTTSVIRYGLLPSSLNSNVAGATTAATTSGTTPITSLTPNTKYYYLVEATNSAGTVQSLVQNFTTTASGGGTSITFSNLISSAITNTTATVSVTLANVCAGSNYRLQVAPSADFAAGTVDTPHQTGGTNGVKNHNLTGLDPNTTYYYRFYASPSQGCGNAAQITSATASFTTTGGASNLITFSNVTSSAITNTTATVSVTLANVCAGATYNLQYSKSSDFSLYTLNNNNLTAGSAGIKTHNLTALEPNTIYYFRFYVSPNQACNTAQIISPSGSFTTTSGTSNAIVFSNLTSSTITNTTATVSVTLANVCVGATYRIQYSTSSAFTTANSNILVDNLISTNVANGVNNINLTALSPNTQYFFRFYGSGSQSCSPDTLYSSTANFTTANSSGQLIAEYNFNNTLNNINGNTPFGSLPANLYEPGRFGALQALRMDSGSRSATIANIPTGNAPRTISLWIKMTVTANWTIFYYGQQTNNKTYGLSFNNSLLTNYGWGNDLTGTVGVPTDVWKHVVCTYSATGQATIYLDGVEVGTAAKPAWNTTFSDFRLNNFPGLVDDLKIYNYALSASEVTNLFTSDSANPITTTPTFAQVPPICSGGTLAALPTTCTNGITGTWSPALNNTTTTTYTFTPTAGQGATTATMTITVTPSVTPAFAAVAPICSGGTLSALPTTSTNGITGTWSPALNNTATTTYAFTPTAGQCATTKTLVITVNPSVTPAFAAVAPICSGATLAALPTTSTNGITGTWSPALNNTATTTYTFTPTAGQCATTKTLVITVNPSITPAFAAVAPICSGGTLAALPTTSTNGITGTWSPALNNTATTTYTFTPAAGQCATTKTLVITVTPSVTPAFAAVAPICSGATLAALPTTSTNGITGTWSPALNNTATTTYTFTPAAGQCATTKTLVITVTPSLTPAFAAVAPICSGGTLAALPTTSTNGITGTWSPALNNTATTTYTFTPAAGQCATTKTLVITVTPNVTPAFAAVAPICSGGTLSALPTTSTNGITGTWSPALNNTATTTYTFTPAAGQCASVVTKVIIVNPSVTPTFVQVAPICAGTTTSPLLLTSTNGITGTWSPAFDNAVTKTYTFTPASGQCAIGTVSMVITVSSSVTPTFTQINPVCLGSASTALPTTSNNGVVGTWIPAVINTAVTTTYVFTPNSGQCATATASMTISVNSSVTPAFAAVAPICSGGTLSALPTTSTNGITGTWSPALNNTATTTYTFTPAAGQCATTKTLVITVNPSVTPAFAVVAPICSGGTLVALPTTSTNGITGTWSPALNNTATTTYTFTPAAGQCATSVTKVITVNPSVTPAFAAVAPICTGGTLAALPTTSTNGITGTWSPALNNTATTTYTFTPTAGQCATTATLTITVSSSIVPTFAVINPICSGATLAALPTTSTNGITGTWSPALNNTATTTYTFTPTAGQCGTAQTLSIVVISTEAPTGASTQTFVEGTTIASIIVAPENVIWYASSANAISGNNALPSSTLLVDGSVYYAVSEAGGCRSNPLAVTIAITLSIEEQTKFQVKIYPNPVSDILNIESENEIKSVVIYSVQGQIVQVSNQKQIDISRIAAGIYMIRIQDTEDIVLTKKFMKN